MAIKVKIVPFHSSHQPGVAAMRAAIATEYPLPFFHSSSPGMEALSQLPGHKYWVALADDTVVGTVGVIVNGNVAILKSLFVAKEYRGAQAGVALELLNIAIEEATNAGCHNIYLGTMEQFLAAQRFYEKYGFERIGIKDVPNVFPQNDFDVLFFKKQLVRNMP